DHRLFKRITLQQIHQETVMTTMKPDIKLLEPVEASYTTADEIATLIDDIGNMLPAVRARQKRIKALQNALQPYADKMKALTALVSAIESHEADETFRREGELFTAMIGKRCVVRTVTDPALAITLLN